jgi:hypothetical protein
MRTHVEGSTEGSRSIKSTLLSSPRFLGPLLVAATLLSGQTASAAEDGREYNRFEFTPFAGYMFGGEFEDPTDNSERDLDEGSTIGLFVNIAEEYWRHYEFLFTDLDTEVDGTVPIDMGVQYLQIGGTVSHPEARYVIPYFGMTFGAARFSPDEASLDDETKFAFSAGGGVRIPVTDHIGIRFDARAFLTLLDTEGDLFCASQGGTGTCAIRAKGDTFLQYTASLGVTFAF